MSHLVLVLITEAIGMCPKPGAGRVDLVDNTTQLVYSVLQTLTFNPET